MIPMAKPHAPECPQSPRDRLTQVHVVQASHRGHQASIVQGGSPVVLDSEGGLSTHARRLRNLLLRNSDSELLLS